MMEYKWDDNFEIFFLLIKTKVFYLYMLICVNTTIILQISFNNNPYNVI